LSSRLVVMKLTLALLALVGCAFASTSISSSNCVNGHCVSCDNNGCRETRSVDFARSTRGVSVCNCIGSSCRACDENGCNEVPNCDRKRSVETREKREQFFTCQCLNGPNSGCKVCGIASCHP
ncbi:hypothetical protein PFISCL1PPCAC_7788, partial [Pristionchus fissidentatus]